MLDDLLKFPAPDNATIVMSVAAEKCCSISHSNNLRSDLQDLAELSQLEIDRQRDTDPWSRFNHNKTIIVRPRDLPSILGISRTTCWRLSKDPNSGFPKRIRMSSGCVGFYLHQLTEWLESRQVLD